MTSRIRSLDTVRALRQLIASRPDLATTRLGIPFEQISRDAQIALTEFNESFLLAMTQDQPEPWAGELGLEITSDAPRIRFPLPLSAAGYIKFKGEMKYRTMSEKSLELIPIEWQDGVEELASIIEAPDFIGWNSEPERMALAAVSLSNELIAEALTANPATWETNNGSINFFQSTSTSNPSFSAGSHPYNVFDLSKGGFDNDFAGATLPSHQNLQIAKTRFRRLKAANGKNAGYRLRAILAPPPQEEIWRNILEQDLIIQSLPLNTSQGDGSAANSFGAVDNRHKGTVELIIADELGADYTREDGSTGSDSIWYAIATGKERGRYPWVSHRQASPEVIIRDKSSEFYKNTRKVSIGHVLKAQGALSLPQMVQRWAGTSS